MAGEISNLSRAASGHIYFTLKDERGALRCAFFRNRNVGQRTPLAEGIAQWAAWYRDYHGIKN